MISIERIESASLSEVFHKGATHLLTQFEKSLFGDDEEACAYRGDNGTKCAAGVFIEDKDFDKGFEGNKWQEVVERCGGNQYHDNHKLIRRLQVIHDNSFPYSWPARLRELAAVSDIVLSAELEALLTKREAEEA